MDNIRFPTPAIARIERSVDEEDARDQQADGGIITFFYLLCGRVDAIHQASRMDEKSVVLPPSLSHGLIGTPLGEVWSESRPDFGTRTPLRARQFFVTNKGSVTHDIVFRDSNFSI